MRVCPRCGRPLSQRETVCPVCATFKKRKPYWVFVIAGLLIVIVLMAVALYYLTLDREDDHDREAPSYENRQEDPEKEPDKPGVVPEEPGIVPQEPEEPEDSDVIPTEPEKPEEPEEPNDLYAQGPYKSEGFYSDGALRGYRDEDVLGIACIDVSAYQGQIDWTAAANAGVQAAMIRVGFRGWGAAGTMVTDEYFRANIEGALNAGVEVGVYFFSQATTEEEAIEEANYTMNLLRDYSITYPVIFNWEQMPNGRTAAMTKDRITACAKAFCDAVEQEGYRGGIYFNQDWVYDCYDVPALSSYILWCARYTQLPDFPYDFSIWQYSNTGSIPGIIGNVDLNIIFTNQ